MSAEILQRLMLGMPALLLSLTVHEFAHAWVATKLGDQTPTRQGRLTLSPISHIDPLGTLIFPIVLTLLHAPVLGWAKPVEFHPANFTRRLTIWQGTVLAAIAGPMSNLLLALLSAIGLRFAVSAHAPQSSFAMQFAVVMFQLNVLLAVFNAFPLPPLDGGHLIPPRFVALRDFLHRYSFMLFLLLFFIPLPGLHASVGFLILQPVMDLLQQVLFKVVGLG